MMKKERKKGQLTIFIILAIVIVAALLILLYPRIKILIAGPVAPDYIRECTEDSVDEVLEKIELQGGSLAPENYILYNNEKVDYVCYTNEYYKTCTMQKPLLKQDIENEITSYITPKIKDCFLSLEAQLEKRGSDVSLGKVEIKTEIIPNSILVTINAPLTISKGETTEFNKFRVGIDGQLYNLVMISSSIANYEARYGDADPLTYMLYYPNIKIEKKVQSEGTAVYIVTDRPTGEKFMFASRSLAFPPGLIGDKYELEERKI